MTVLTIFTLLQSVPPQDAWEGGATTAALVAVALGLVEAIKFALKAKKDDGNPSCSREVKETVREIDKKMDDYLHKLELRDAKHSTIAGDAKKSNNALLGSQDRLIGEVAKLVEALGKVKNEKKED